MRRLGNGRHECLGSRVDVAACSTLGGGRKAVGAKSMPPDEPGGADAGAERGPRPGADLRGRAGLACE